MRFWPTGPKAIIYKFPGRATFPCDTVVTIHLSPGKTHTWHFLFKKRNFRMTGNKLLFLLQWRACDMPLPCPGGNLPLSLSTELPLVTPHIGSIPQHLIATWTFLGSESPHLMGTTASPTSSLVHCTSGKSFLWLLAVPHLFLLNSYLPVRIKDAVRFPRARLSSPW